MADHYGACIVLCTSLGYQEQQITPVFLMTFYYRERIKSYYHMHRSVT